MIVGFDKSIVVFDLRCLQDPNYARRGIGRHVLSLLNQGRRLDHIRMEGLIDPVLPPLLTEARDAVCSLHTNAYAAGLTKSNKRRPRCFISASPMTHDPLFVGRLLSKAEFLRVSIVYDFIPRHEPERYLPDA